MAGKKKVDESAPAAYIVLHPVHHDGDLYKRKDTIELTDSQAQPLLALGVIEAAK